MTKIAWVFPGQGSQTAGMGSDLADIAPAKAKFERAEQILGWSVLEACRDEEKLSHTLYTQPCLYVVEAILADLLAQKGYLPQLVAGHSLGEYVALYASEVFDFETGLRLVKRRAELMDAAVGGKMVALMQFDRQELEKIVSLTPDATIANDNSESQAVISGTPSAIDEVLSRVKAKRTVTLKVSGAFHSPLMASAAEQFSGFLESVPFADAKVPVLSNVEPSASTDGQSLKRQLLKQMTAGVRWREIMLRFPTMEISRAIEIGPGKVLTGLIKRTCPDMELTNIGTLADLEESNY